MVPLLLGVVRRPRLLPLLLRPHLPRDLLLHRGARLTSRVAADPRAQQCAEHRQDHRFPNPSARASSAAR
jgi:hypothetical protein